MKKIVIIWVDAFSDRFLTPELAPFLSDFSKECFFARISPLFAYMGIEYSFEYGVPISELGIWNDHVYSGLKSAGDSGSSLFARVVGFVDRVSLSDDLNKALRYAFFKVCRVRYGVPHLIPSNLIRSFPVPEYHFDRESLFDLLRKNGVRFLRKEPKFNRSEASLIRSVPGLLRDYDVLLFKLNSLDRLGHKYGPLSKVVKQRVIYLDKLIMDLSGKLDKDVVLIVMSDHGMVPVTNRFDLMRFLNEKGFEYGRDYIAFVGATYVSFWFRDPKNRKEILAVLSTLDAGTLLTVDDKVQLGISSLGTEYGQEIFVAKEHTVFFPEFYHRRRAPKGMHGYAGNCYDRPVFMMRCDIPLRKTTVQIDFVDIMPTILSLFNLPLPASLKGSSLVV